MKKIDASRIYPKLWVGSFPPPQLRAAGFDAVVLCASESQHVKPDIFTIRAPFDDAGRPITTEEFHRAWKASKVVTKLRANGKRVLVTCHMGVNRSAFVAALSLMQLEGLPAKIAIERVRKERQPAVDRTGHRVLGNESFVEALHKYERMRGTRH